MCAKKGLTYLDATVSVLINKLLGLLNIEGKNPATMVMEKRCMHVWFMKHAEKDIFEADMYAVQSFYC